MSCSSLKHRFEEEKQRGLSFRRAMEIYQEVQGSLAAHREELEELRRAGTDTARIGHLEQHIRDGEMLCNEIERLRLS
ncbi:MAG: hypothetical protein AB1776_03375 [Bacillota bacterium]